MPTFDEVLEQHAARTAVAEGFRPPTEQNRRVSAAGGDIKSFADARRVIVEPKDPGECRYGEEFESESPKPGESHWVSAVDEVTFKCDASPIQAVLIERAANRIRAKQKELEVLRALVVSAKLPGCTFIVDRRLKDVERHK